MALGVRPDRGGVSPRPTTWRERLGALRYLPPFLALVTRADVNRSLAKIGRGPPRRFVNPNALSALVEDAKHFTRKTTEPTLRKNASDEGSDLAKAVVEADDGRKHARVVAHWQLRIFLPRCD